MIPAEELGGLVREGVLARQERTCWLCGEQGELATTPNGLEYCTDEPWCLYRARLRLGVPERGYWRKVDGRWYRRGGARELLLKDLREAGRRPGVYA